MGQTDCPRGWKKLTECMWISHAGASIKSEGWLLARRKKRWGVYVKSYSENQGLLAFALNGEFIFLFLVVSK